MDNCEDAIPAAALAALQSSLKQQQAQAHWRELHCTLLTPMYGGGVEAGEIDHRMPIRASGIRGQLRFWWRLAYGANLTSQQLFDNECALWGGLDSKSPQKSKIKIRVECAQLKPPSEYKEGEKDSPYTCIKEFNDKKFNSKGIKYAIGCAGIDSDHTSSKNGRDTKAKNSNYWLKQGFEFKLLLHYPEDCREQVETTLALWANFGGLGGRTRRGFGAVKVTSNHLKLDHIDEAYINQRKLPFTVVHSPANYPNAIEAWGAGVNALQAFRQSRKPGKKDEKGRSRPGLSHWPEADQIRYLTGEYAKEHKPVHEYNNYFPRAAFGLPIAIDFGDENRRRGDPETYNLLPAQSERLASPLILRPFLPPSDNGKQNKKGEKYCAMALLLPHWEEALKTPLKFNEKAAKKPQVWPESIQERAEFAKKIAEDQGRGPLSTFKANADPLSAFMAFFKQSVKQGK